jgi:iron complex transport system substrate-binding protein
MTRSALQEVTAVKTGRVYVCSFFLTAGELNPIGELYFAKWLHPELFTDIDPGAIHIQLVQKYFGENPNGTWVVLRV